MGIEIFLNLILFPKSCQGCERLGVEICESCASTLTKVDFDQCLVCGNLTTDGDIHAYCRKDRIYPDKFFCSYIYENLCKKIIVRSKHGPKSYQILRSLVYTRHSIETLIKIPEIDIIIPAPLSQSGGKIANHANYIATEISSIIRKPNIDLLIKDKRTKAQKFLNKEQRIQNLKGKIMIKPNSIDLVKSKTILVIDDVTTTGATLSEITKVLKQNKAGKVYAFTLAKDV